MNIRHMGMLFALVSLLATQISAAPPEVTVFKTKTCGCCGKWVDHMRSSGFKVIVNEVSSTAEYRQKNGVPEKLQSCHTAIAGGYSFEGHVPAAEIQRILKEKPRAKGLAVPGMPMGSPGMEGSRRDPYSVVTFDQDGTLTVYQKYPGEGQ